MKQDELRQKFCERIGYTFDEQDYIRYALTHPSTSKTTEEKRYYQRLEFLGDRVLSLVLSEWLWRLYPQASEAELSKRLAFLGCGETLVRVGQSLCLQDYASFIVQGKQLSSILADTCEAVIGALYMDGGLGVAEGFIHRYWQEYVQQSVKTDSKTALQEWVQEHYSCLPTYNLTAKGGLSHDPWFEVEVCVQGMVPVRERDRSKRKAERRAAAQMLFQLKKISEQS